jgi:serine/threonine protein kinase
MRTGSGYPRGPRPTRQSAPRSGSSVCYCPPVVTESLKDGRYVITQPLGEGSQGTTLEAVDKREGRLVAIKRFEVKTARKWKDVELAEREARVLASLSNPALPAYVEHFEENGTLYLVMERIEGASLPEYRKSGGAFGMDDAITLLEQAAIVLDYLHGRAPPIIHRDLKPGNVIRRPDKSFAFVDFGAVRDTLRLEGGSTIIGTFGYMAPEQFQGRAAPASDVYAIGATVLWMLTGVQPEDLPHKGLAIDVPAALGPQASPALVGVLAAMLEPDPDKRAPRIGPLLAPLHAAPPRPRVAPAPPPPPPPPVADAGLAPPDEEFPDSLLRLVRRFMPLLWVLSAFAWWWLPFRTAMGFTVGLVVLSVVTRPYRAKRAERKLRRYARDAGVRVADPRTRVSEPDPKEVEAEAERAWREEEEQRRRRG